MKITTSNNKTLIAVLITLCLFSCEEFVHVDLPNSQVTSANVFENDKTAIAAATGMYRTMLSSQSFVGGVFTTLSYLGGLSSDELIDYSGTTPYTEFFRNELSINNSAVLTIWSTAYNTVYEANAVIEGVRSSKSLSETVKRQLEGEAKFVRAFCHFYLVNLYGDIPLVVSTDYRQNALLGRTKLSDVYAQIVSDLEDAQRLLTESYFLSGRTRPNKWTATAMLARVYLYLKDYENATKEATSVINATTLYNLVPDLPNVFLANSNGAIWQLSQEYPNGVPTGDGYIFTITNDYFTKALDPGLVNAFKTDDDRRTSWISTYINSSGVYYYPSKYKVRIFTSGSSYPEYLMILRLAEQYLIRAEARAAQNDISGAQDDLNKIRNRAGLANTTADDQVSLLKAIQEERRLELFCEFGHRWLDLKRTETANAILEPIKSGWNIEDRYYPIPESEMLNDPHLQPQNPGY